MIKIFLFLLTLPVSLFASDELDIPRGHELSRAEIRKIVAASIASSDFPITVGQMKYRLLFKQGMSEFIESGETLLVRNTLTPQIACDPVTQEQYLFNIESESYELNPNGSCVYL